MDFMVDAVLSQLRLAANAYKEAKIRLSDYNTKTQLGIDFNDDNGVAMVYAVIQMLSGQSAKSGSPAQAIQSLDQDEISRLVSEKIIEYLNGKYEDAVKPAEYPAHVSIDEGKIARLVADELKSYFATSSLQSATPEYMPPVNGRVPYVTVLADLDISDFDVDDENLEEYSESEEILEETDSDKEEEINTSKSEGGGDENSEDGEEFDEEYHNRTRVLNKRIGILLKTLTSSSWQPHKNYSAPADVRDVYNEDFVIFILTKQESNENLRLMFKEFEDELRVYYTLQVPEFIQGAGDIRTDFVEDAKFNLSEIMSDFVQAFCGDENEYDGDPGFFEAADWFSVYDECD